MPPFSRRKMLLGTTAVAATSAIGSGHLPAASSAPDRLSARQVLALIRGTESDWNAERLGMEPAKPVQLAEPLPSRVRRRVEPAVVTRQKPDGTLFAIGLTFSCDPQFENELAVDGMLLEVTRFSYSVTEMSWTAARGAPVYEDYAPRYDYARDARYPEAKRHQIVPLIGNGYFVGCQPSGICESPVPGPIAFDVNDHQYDDHAGYYVVTIWGLA